MKRIKTIQEMGSTILFVAHDVGAVRTLCENVVWLDGGRVRMAGDVFPVTGSYMESLFDDHATEVAVPISDEHCLHPLTESVINGSVNAPQPKIEAYDAKPVTHWGSHVGSILHAGIYNAQRERINVIKWGEEIEVQIGFKVPLNASRQHLSVAFSIKNLKGTDLIVSTTHDWGTTHFEEKNDAYLARFKFSNYLINDKYLLVVAIEDRSSAAIHYYEYLEGAHYFSSVADTRLFGLFQPQIQQEVTATHE